MVGDVILSIELNHIVVAYNHAFNKDLSVNASLTFADAITHITKYGTTTSVTGYYNGKEYGEIWGYTVDRLYQKSDWPKIEKSKSL